MRKYFGVLTVVGLLVVSISGTHIAQNQGIEISKIEIRVKNRVLKAYYARPQGDFQPNSIPGVAVFHGFSASKEMMRPFTEGLARAGFGVVAISQQGHGLSAGVLGEDGNNSLRNDGIAAISYLRDQPIIDKAKIGVVGHSMGGGTAIQTQLFLGGIGGSVIIGNSLQDLSTTSVNTSSPKNIMLAIGRYDELFSVQEAHSTMEKLVGGSVEESKRYGAFENGTARKIVVTSTNHIFEVINPTIVTETIDWLVYSLFDENSIDEYNTPNGYRFVLDQLLSLFGGLMILSILPLVLLQFSGKKGRNETGRGNLLHGLPSFAAFFLAAPLGVVFFGNFLFLFMGWFLIGFLLYSLSSSKKFGLKNTFKHQKNLIGEEWKFGLISFLIFLIGIQVFLYLVNWDFRFVLPLMSKLDLRRTLIFLLLFLPGIVFFAAEINHLSSRGKNALWGIIQESMVRIWPYTIILLLHYLPIIILQRSLLPLDIGFLAFFLIGFLPVMVIVSFFTVTTRLLDHSAGIAVFWSSGLISWLLASTLPFV